MNHEPIPEQTEEFFKKASIAGDCTQVTTFVAMPDPEEIIRQSREIARMAEQRKERIDQINRLISAHMAATGLTVCEAMQMIRAGKSADLVEAAMKTAEPPADNRKERRRKARKAGKGRSKC